MRFLAVLLVFSVTCAHGADRPTPEEVKKAVFESQARYVAKNTPTKDEALAELKEEYEAIEKEAKRISKLDHKEFPGAERIPFSKFPLFKKRAISKMRQEYDAKVAEYKRTEANYTPPVIEPKLASLSKVEVGNVGTVASKGYIEVFQVIDDRSFLGHAHGEFVRYVPRVYNLSGGQAVSMQRTVEKYKGPLRLYRVDTDETLVDGKKISGGFDAVVTGTYEYTNTLGARKTVFVIEQFDSTKVEEWQ